MYSYIWQKYFPVIRILIKRSAEAEQMLELNRIDFERTGKGRKAIYKFNIEFNNGKVTTMISANELAQTLASILMQDAVTKELLLLNDYEFRLNSKFQLFIKNLKKPEEYLQEEINVEEVSLPA